MKELRIKDVSFPVLLDDDIYDEVKKHTWIVTERGIVAQRFEEKELLTLVSGKGPEEWVYFLDGDKSNYQKENLRLIPRNKPPTAEALLEAAWARSKRGNGHSSIYFLGCDENRNIKIGISKNPLQRKRELQAGSPVKLYVRAVIDRQTENDEARLHRIFKDCRLWGEWFTLNDEMERFINEFAVDEVHPEVSARDKRKGRITLKRRLDK